MARFSAVLLGLTLPLLACENLRPAAVVRPLGDVDPVRDQELAEKSGEVADVSDVRVVRGSIPEGLDLTEGGHKLRVLPGYERRYRVLGSVEADYERSRGADALRNTYWTFDYQSGFLDGYCGAQVPFKLLTLGIWVLVPFQYPCFKTAWTEDTRVTELHASVRRSAKALGGNLVLLTSEQSTVYVNGGGTQVGSSSNTGLKGFALYEDSSATPSEAEDPEVR